MAGEESIQGLQERLGVVEWGIGRCMREPDDAEKAQLEWYRMRIVGYWLDEVLAEMEHEKTELEREIEERVAKEPTVISKAFEAKLMEFDVRQTVVEVVELQVRCRQVRMETEWCEGILGEVGEMMMEAVSVAGEDGDVHGGVSDARETEEELDEVEEGEVFEDEEKVGKTEE